jgi:hypothetical protein
MFAIGAVSTIPLGMEIFGERSQSGKDQPGKDQLRTAV